jgi:aspartyl-tRNA(Asn)/glutamyl-tRNA(Gln) amidotransferase subunit A
MLDEETAKAVEAAIEVLTKLTRSTADCYLPATSGFSSLALRGELEAYHLELFRRNEQRYSLGVRQNMASAEKALDDVASEPCSEKVVDYITSNWQLILTRKSIDDAFKDFDLVALPTMRILPRTVNDALNREEEIKPREPEVISNCTPFNIFGLPAISIPCGFSASGLPIGLMIAGPRFSEGKVLALANAYENATDWHKKRPVLSPDMVVPSVTRKT